MEIPNNFLPGNLVWVMVDGWPKQCKVVNVTIQINQELETKVEYLVATESGHKTYNAVFTTKDELKHYIFGF